METSEKFSTFKSVARTITITDYFIPQLEQPVVLWENRLKKIKQQDFSVLP